MLLSGKSNRPKILRSLVLCDNGDSVFAARAGKFKNGNLGGFTGSHKIAVKSVTKVSVDDEHFSYIYT